MRLIDADRLLKMMSHWKPYMDMDNVREAIKKMPTIDAVPVVRCKDPPSTPCLLCDVRIAAGTKIARLSIMDNSA